MICKCGLKMRPGVVHGTWDCECGNAHDEWTNFWVNE
jgi:hypothetical protein